MANETIEIGPTEIAKLLFPMKKMLGETRGALVERVKAELEVENEDHAGFIVDYMETTGYLVKDKIEGPWKSEMDVYTLTNKAEKTFREYL